MRQWSLIRIWYAFWSNETGISEIRNRQYSTEKYYNFVLLWCPNLMFYSTMSIQMSAANRNYLCFIGSWRKVYNENKLNLNVFPCIVSGIWLADIRPGWLPWAHTYAWMPHIDAVQWFRFNTGRPRQNGRHFADAILRCIFLNENAWIPIEISLKFFS